MGVCHDSTEISRQRNLKTLDLAALLNPRTVEMLLGSGCVSLSLSLSSLSLLCVCVGVCVCVGGGGFTASCHEYFLSGGGRGGRGMHCEGLGPKAKGLRR